MKLSTVNEAADYSVEDAVTKFKRHPIGKSLFGGNPDLANFEQIIQTAKHLVLNNPRVKAFVKARSGLRNLSTYDLDELRKVVPKDVPDQDKVEVLSSLKEFISNLSREINITKKGTISASTKKEIEEWVNSNGGWHNLSSTAIQELMSVPGLRPTKPVVLYRGILFKQHHLEKNYDGSDKDGLAFLKSIRKNTGLIDLSWKRPSSWTYYKGTAEKFARFAAAHSTFEATLGWLHRGAEERFIDGDLGFVIAIRAKPEDILVDMRNIDANSRHGEEGEVILKPGTQLAKILHKYTVKGEVSPIEDDTVDSLGLIQKVDTFYNSINFSSLEDIKLDRTQGGWAFNYKDYYNPENIKVLVSATEPLINLFKQVLAVGKELFANIDPKNLRVDMIDISNETEVQKFEALSSLVEFFHQNYGRKKYGSGETPKPLHSLDAIEAFKQMPGLLAAKDIVSAVKNSDGTTSVKSKPIVSSDWSIKTLTDVVREKMNKRVNLTTMGAAKQEEALTPIWKEIVEAAGRKAPDNYSELAYEAVKVLNRSKRTYDLYQKLLHIRDLQNKEKH